MSTAAAPATASVAEERSAPRIELSEDEAGAGGDVTVSGTGWRPESLLTLLICGQNAIGGTNSCANAAGRAVTTGADGAFQEKIPVAEPPKPCPCVVRASTVTGAYASADAEFTVAGHPVKRLPEDRGGGRLSVLAARLEGSSGLLTWFGAPPQRQLVLTVGNLGAEPAKDPVFETGTAHGVYSPEWERRQWSGTIDPGQKKRVALPVELAAGAHGDYTVSAKYGKKLLTEQPWDVGRPWGVTLFWALLFLVVPAAVFRAGMAAVDRVRPRRPGRATGRTRVPGLGRGRTAPEPAPATDDAHTGALPWFAPGTLGAGAPPATGTGATPDRGPELSSTSTVSAPFDDRPPSKGNAT
ncbi:neocarzinostatin apoprotein domain-containing protein [Streptomyces sp. HNM0574]|uniref:neocarzinostatin apoprotein domain-containing protein n=1 Tax=Streptomyces sp. HNM0574 TaxID=2714954 RepID=UPI00146E7E1E|nr:neocarzinostatin apoprotein domain-containing protein [Streptomyces sp. HNM0574]NLU70809.1 hypothetical protein [Streptomyces sp. HNM0574]